MLALYVNALFGHGMSHTTIICWHCVSTLAVCQYVNISHQHCVSYFLDGQKTSATYWQLVDKVVQQVALNTKEGGDPDGAPLEIDMKKLGKQLV